MIPSVSEVCRAIKNTLYENFNRVAFTGEISEFTCHRGSGHWYFTVKDNFAQIKCAMFIRDNQKADFMPRIGDQVDVAGAIDVYEKSGQMQCIVRLIRRSGAGTLYEQFIRFKNRLEAEGLFAVELKRPIPKVPRVIGVITGMQTAALRDVLIRLKARAPFADVIIYPTSVQGTGAAREIAGAINTASMRNEADVLLLVRGGGSIEDLWSFNEEIVARAIRASRVPIIAGIGHESDVTIADLAADKRAATPTAAAEAASLPYNELFNSVEGVFTSISRNLKRSFDHWEMSIDFCLRSLGGADRVLWSYSDRVRHASESLRWAGKTLTQDKTTPFIMECREGLRRKIADGKDRLEVSSARFVDPKILIGDFQQRIDRSSHQMAMSMNSSLSTLKEQVGTRAHLISKGKPILPIERVNSLFATIEKSFNASTFGRQALFQKRVSNLLVYRPKWKPDDTNRLIQSIGTSAKGMLEAYRSRLEVAESKLQALDPKKVLGRGYAWVEAEGSIVNSVDQLKVGQGVDIILSDGEANARIVTTKKA